MSHLNRYHYILLGENLLTLSLGSLLQQKGYHSAIVADPSFSFKKGETLSNRGGHELSYLSLLGEKWGIPSLKYIKNYCRFIPYSFKLNQKEILLSEDPFQNVQELLRKRVLFTSKFRQEGESERLSKGLSKGPSKGSQTTTRPLLESLKSNSFHLKEKIELIFKECATLFLKENSLELNSKSNISELFPYLLHKLHSSYFHQKRMEKSLEQMMQKHLSREWIDLLSLNFENYRSISMYYKGLFRQQMVSYKKIKECSDQITFQEMVEYKKFLVLLNTIYFSKKGEEKIYHGKLDYFSFHFLFLTLIYGHYEIDEKKLLKDLRESFHFKGGKTIRDEISDIYFNTESIEATKTFNFFSKYRFLTLRDEVQVKKRKKILDSVRWTLHTKGARPLLESSELIGGGPFYLGFKESLDLFSHMNCKKIVLSNGGLKKWGWQLFEFFVEGTSSNQSRLDIHDSTVVERRGVAPYIQRGEEEMRTYYLSNKRDRSRVNKHNILLKADKEETNKISKVSLHYYAPLFHTFPGLEGKKFELLSDQIDFGPQSRVDPLHRLRRFSKLKLLFSNHPKKRCGDLYLWDQIDRFLTFYFPLLK